MPAQQSLVIKAKGLHTNNNYFSSAPEGSMSEAVNVVIDRDEVVEPRRGFFQYAELTGMAQQLINYKDRVLAHVADKIYFDNGFGKMTAFGGSDVDPVSGIRLKSIETNGNLYFVTNEGIKKISARSASDFPLVEIEYAGGVKAVDLSVVLNPNQFGWLEPNKAASYRMLFGKKDLNDNLILGSVSSRATVANPSAQACISTYSFSIPANVKAGDFYQLYRTPLATLGAEDNTGEEMYLVVEDTITEADLVAGQITGDDITSESFRERGALLYTNPVSGEGLTQSNEPPPFAKDICLYKGFTFLANTKSVQRLNLDYLTINGIVPTGNPDATILSVTDGTTTTQYQYQGDFETATFDFVNFPNIDAFTNQYGVSAEATITIETFGSLQMPPMVTPATVVVNGITLTEGVEWAAGSSNDDTATSLKDAIDALPLVSATVAGNVITVKIDQEGTAGNYSPLSSSNATQATGTVTIANYLGLTGQAITIDASTLTEGIEWFANTDNDTTAQSLTDAINNLNGGFKATRVTNVVTITSDVYSSTANSIPLATTNSLDAPVSGATLTGGANNGLSMVSFLGGIDAAPGAARYFTLTSANDERKYYVWYYRSVADEDPRLSLPGSTLLAGHIGIKVIVDPTDTIADVLNNTKDEIYVITGDFNIDILGTVMTIECSNNGTVTTASSEGTFLQLVGQVNTDGNGIGEDIANYKIFLPRSTGENAPTPSLQLEQIGKSTVKLINKKDLLVNAYYVSGYDDVDGKMLLEHKQTTGNAFWVNLYPANFVTPNPNPVGELFNPTVLETGSSVISSNEIRPNRIYYSKYQQPDAFPIPNYIDIGPKDREIKRIVPLRDALFILKEDGIYKLTGDSAGPGGSGFSVQEFDFSAQVLAPDTAVVLNNQIYALSSQGVCVISDSGVSIISRPIENKILQLTKSGTQYKTLSFGLAYESDRSYHLHTVSRIEDQICTQVFRYNNFTDTWTNWNMSKNCGVVNFADDKMYLGATDINYIEKERKSLNRTDHADREYPVVVKLNGVTPGVIELSSTDNTKAGDVLYQRQYVTIAQFNRVLQKLDQDQFVADNDYESILSMSRGQDIRVKLEALALKLDNDAGVNYTNYSALIDNISQTVVTSNPAISISTGQQATLTFASNTIATGRWVAISNSNCVPSIDGVHEVVASTPTSITINREVNLAGTTAEVQTVVNNFRDIQYCFNAIVNRLNDDTGVFFGNYLPSVDYQDFEITIQEVDNPNTSIGVNQLQDFVFGEAYIINSIPTTFTYNPQFMGDPSVEKQFSVGTFHFEDGNFSNVFVSYATDKSPSYDEIAFKRSGNGDFGMSPFGSVNFGGVAAPVPLRTYIPLDKQRGRFISIRFDHSIALENYALLGVHLNFRPYNTRSYR